MNFNIEGFGRGDIQIEDYRLLNEDRHEFLSGRNRNQPGGPRKLATAIVELAAPDTPPVRWAVGSDALQSFEGRARQLRDSATRWHDLSVSTDSAA